MSKQTLWNRREIALRLSAAGTALTLQAAGPRRRPSTPEPWARTELYFGTQKPGGETVTEDQFREFLDTEVTPRFPDGLTLLSGYGQFRNSAGITVKEQSLVLILLIPSQTEQTNRAIDEIRETYKRIHYQESVLRVDSFAMVSF